ncbi:MAG: hypothetical protein AAFX76_09400, partial [Planctomycetota bacterium]
SAVVQDQPTLDELLDLAPPGNAPGSSETPEESEPAIDPVAPIAEVQDRLTGQQVSDTFETAVRDMGAAAARLDEDDDPGLDTQRLQESILERLDQLIEAAQQQQQQSSSGGGGGSSASNQDSAAQNAGQGQPPSQTPGEGESSAAAASGGGENPGQFSPGQVGPVEPGQGPIDEVRSEWGALPPRLRDELSNGLDEPYSPVYRDLTEAYYRRLAEEAGE